MEIIALILTGSSLLGTLILYLRLKRTRSRLSAYENELTDLKRALEDPEHPEDHAPELMLTMKLRDPISVAKSGRRKVCYSPFFRSPVTVTPHQGSLPALWKMAKLKRKARYRR